MADTDDRKRMKVLCPVQNEKTQRTWWMRMGTAFENRDGSTNIYLDALPTNGRLQLRLFDESDRQRSGSKSAGGESSASDPLPF